MIWERLDSVLNNIWGFQQHIQQFLYPTLRKYLLFVAAVNTMAKNNFERRGLILADWWQSVIKGSPAGAWSRTHWRDAACWATRGSWSVSFLTQPRPTVGWALPRQSQIKKMLPWPTRRPVWWRQLLSWGSPFKVSLGLCQQLKLWHKAY